VTLLFHVDESADDRYQYHVGVLVTGEKAAKAEALLDEVVARAYEAGISRQRDAELHGHEIHSRCGDWGEASVPDSISVYSEALDVVAQSSIEVIARGINLAAFGRRYPGRTPYVWEFSNLLERLNERLEVLDDYGIVIADEQHQYRHGLQRDVVHARRFGTGGYRDQRLTRILDTAHFVDSRLSRVTQLADLVAFILRRRASYPTEADERAEAAMSDLAAKVYAAIPDPPGQYHTIRH
jgi:hypothetical protein